MVTSWLDGKVGPPKAPIVVLAMLTGGSKHVVFGEVADDQSMKVVMAVEATGSSSGAIKYTKSPVITNAGAE